MNPRHTGVGDSFLLFHFEGHAVRALFHRRICFVGADHNLLQSAVGLGLAVILALGDGALNALVCIAAIAILHWESLHFI